MMKITVTEAEARDIITKKSSKIADGGAFIQKALQEWKLDQVEKGIAGLNTVLVDLHENIKEFQSPIKK